MENGRARAVFIAFRTTLLLARCIAARIVCATCACGDGVVQIALVRALNHITILFTLKLGYSQANQEPNVTKVAFSTP
jgi:hypothetical protein